MTAEPNENVHASLQAASTVVSMSAPATAQAPPGMAEMVRDFDWSATPLGNAASWSRSLQTVVRLMLGSRYAMWLAWGPELTFLCNDAYRPTLGVKQRFIGAPAREVWAEVWQEAGSRIEYVLSTGEATWDENLLLILERNGFKEETWHTFSYSPAHGDSGRVEGMLCVVTEDTRRVLSERRLATVAQLSGAARHVQTTALACEEMLAVLGENRRDLPFVALYLAGAGAQEPGAAFARCAGSTHPLAANLPADAAHASALAEAMREAARTRALVVAEALDDMLPALSAWPEPASRAVIVPLMRQGPHASDAPFGYLVAGVSPRLALDDDYRRFFELIATQAGSTLEGVRAFESERERAEQLAALDRAKTAFFSNVSHELRTPLMLMLSPLEDLVESEPRGERLALLRLARRSGHRLLRLVNSLLDFARIEAGRIDVCFEPTELARLTQAAASHFRSAIERAGLALRVQCSLDEPVFVDRQMWEKIVLNLISNAFKFTLTGHIEVRLARERGHAVLTVEDTGNGIPAHEMGRIFERFHRVEGTHGRSQEGSGIGLALVQELVKLHGGTIEAASELGRGSRFTVRVPTGSAHLPPERIRGRAPEHAAPNPAGVFADEAAGWLGLAAQGEAEEDEARAPASASDRNGGEHEGADGGLVAGTWTPTLRDRRFAGTFGARVLLVDDNADMRAYVGSLLAPAYRVEVAADGVAALEAARRATPDLILSDVMMPRLDGFGLLAAVRRDSALRDVPFILLSARAGEEARIDGLDAGADDYLVKPFPARELSARVGSLLERTQIRRANEQLLELALSSLQDPFFLVDESARITLVNPRFLEMAGLPAAQVLGQPLFDVCPELAHNGFAETLLDALRTRAAHQCETHGPTRERWFETRIYPAAAAQGAAVLMSDVTGRKRDQEALRLRTAQFETLLNEAPLGVYLVDQDLRIRQVNPAAQPLLGGEPDLIGQDIGAVMRRVWSDAYADEIVAIFRRTLATGAPHHTPERMETRRDSDVTECYEWEVHRTPLPENRFGLVCYLRNISAQVRVRRQLEEADHQKDQFLATLSHELRNPLAPIRSAAAILDSALLTPEQLRWAIDVIRRQVGHMSGLLDDLLDLARITCGKLDLRRDVVGLGGVVRTAVEASRPLLERKRHQLFVHAPNADVLVDADPLRLAQVISNLLNNAGKYTDPGGRIEVTVGVEGALVELSVKDNGIGLPPDAHERLFAMFAQIDAGSSRAEGGLGVGLALSKGLVELHGGTIRASSDGIQLGSEFVVSLPIVVPTTPERGAAKESTLIARAVRRVLVVDDNRDAAESLAMLLSIAGHDVRVAHAGEAALALARAFEPQAVLLDLGMPDLSGYEVARALRAMPQARDMVVVALTGWGQDEDRRKTIAAGFDWHITKPADPDQIKALLGCSRGELQAARNAGFALPPHGGSER
ncbi:ATP-binding protein [Paraburkholderia unamae]|uniref:histidine kinase n=1 Tax=Paraburkholderia unamae TaxID=219649 RepID=A0ABX5KAS8_9BURK|nr:ATP-binding protein [Paraburkholderia unamae]PVX72277.1 PAS/PAC sensor hybrid histidine kinase [Paraburkholderia unamae]